MIARGVRNQVAYFVQCTPAKVGYCGQPVFTELYNPEQMAVRFVGGVFATKGKLKKRLRDKAIAAIKKVIDKDNFTIEDIMI